MNIEFRYIGWCHDHGQDKIWCSFKLGGKYYAGWGKRNAKMQFKFHDHSQTLNDILVRKTFKLFGLEKKKKVDYKEIDNFQMFSIFPNFEDDVVKWLTLAEEEGKIC